MEPTVLDYDGLKIGCLPWINAENSERYLNWLQNVKCDWIGAHLELSGFEIKIQNASQRKIKIIQLTPVHTTDEL